MIGDSEITAGVPYGFFGARKAPLTAGIGVINRVTLFKSQFTKAFRDPIKPSPASRTEISVTELASITTGKAACGWG